MQNNFYKQFAKIEAQAMAQRAESMEVLKKAYKNACDNANEEDAAFYARKIRNKLLDNTDKEMSLDRLGLDTSSALKFIVSLTSVLNGAWATYRQELRDISKQDGFPFNITFPAPPDKEETPDGEEVTE